MQVATSITVVPHQPTVVITPTCACCCHNANATQCPASSFTAPRSAATRHQQKSRVEHGPTNDHDQRQFDDSVCNPGGEEQCNAATENDDSYYIRRKTTKITDDRRDRHINDAPITARRNEISATTTSDVDAERRSLQSAAETSGCRSRRPHRDRKVDDPAEPRTANNHHRLHGIKYNRSTDGKVARSICGQGRDASAEDSHHQSAEDFASCTDKMTSSIYASLASFQDVHENNVIDAVRGYLRHQPTPSSSRRRRPATCRRPTPAADGDGSRTVELRQGDVGPLSSLVVIRPAVPQPRTNGRPPALSDGRPKTTSAARDDRQPALWCDSQPAQHHQRQRHVVQTSARTTDSRRDCRRICKSQLLNESICYDGACGFWSSTHCQQ